MMIDEADLDGDHEISFRGTRPQSPIVLARLNKLLSLCHFCLVQSLRR